MLRTVFFLLKIALFIGAMIWLSEQEGSVRIEWMEYTINAHVGLFLAGFLCVILFAIFIYRVIKAFVDFPASLRYYNHVRNKDKGYKALTLGLTAVAAGDTKAALKQARKARDLLPEDHGLPLLLEAQSARLDGREEDAQKSFAALLEHKDASFLGVRGLLQSSLDAGDTKSALSLARQALSIHPKQPWILRTVYDLEIGEREWNAAEDTIKRAVKAGAITKERALSDRVAMALALALEAEGQGLHDVAQSQYREAQKLDRYSVPAILLSAEYHLRHNEAKKAKTLIEKSWKKIPHAAFVDVWTKLLSENKEQDAIARLKWYETLVKINPDNARTHVAAGLAACDAALWGEARKFFDKAEAIRPSKELYKALAALEIKATGNEEASRQWLEKATEVPAERVWICRETGRIYPSWHPIAHPHNSFNTIEWNYPLGEDVNDGETVLLTASIQATDELNDTLIEAPKVV